MDKRFLTAFLQPEKTNIAGYKLDPFCFRHLITLEAIGSPYLDSESAKDGKLPLPEDILIFLKICSSPDWCTALSKKTLKDKMLFHYLKYDIEKYIKVNTEIITYFHDSFSVPKLWNKVEGVSSVSNKKDSFHQSILTISVLMSKFGFSEKDAWNLPISRAAWYAVSYTKIEGGDIDVIRTSEEDRANEDLIKLSKIEEDALKQFSKIIKDRKVKL